MSETSKLLKQIEADALNPGADLGQALRRVITLGGISGSERLREWAAKELKGYDGTDELPPYRRLRAPLVLDGISGNYQVTSQAVSPMQLPEFARDSINENVALGMPLAEVEHLTKGSDQTVRLQPPGSSDLVHYINATNDQNYQHVERLYWQVSKSSLVKVLDGVRTTLVELVSEIRTGLGDSSIVDVPRELADQVVNVVIEGHGHRVKFGQFAMVSGNGQVRVGDRGGNKARIAWIGAVGTLLAAAAAMAGLLFDVF